MPLLTKMMESTEKFEDKAIEFAQEQVARREEEEDQLGYVPRHKSIMKKAVEAAEDFIAERGSPRSRSRSSSSSSSSSSSDEDCERYTRSSEEPGSYSTVVVATTTSVVNPGVSDYNTPSYPTANYESRDDHYTESSRDGSTVYERRTVEVSSYPQNSFVASNSYESTGNTHSNYSQVREEADSYTTSSVYRPPYDQNEVTNTCYERTEIDNNAGVSSSYSSRVEKDISYPGRSGTGLTSRNNSSSYHEEDISYYSRTGTGLDYDSVRDNSSSYREEDVHYCSRNDTSLGFESSRENAYRKEDTSYSSRTDTGVGFGASRLSYHEEYVSYSSRADTRLDFESSRENRSTYREEDNVSYEAFSKMSLESSSRFEGRADDISRGDRRVYDRFRENDTYESSRVDDAAFAAMRNYPNENRESDSYSYSSSREYSSRSRDEDADYYGRSYPAIGSSTYSRRVVTSTRTQNY
ncbi:hypothetical protein GN244_ATG05334 [Phytophthora infestans]|uniref:Uncharacterized protein n=1 Tax=Phytophthora infestans TaxID=4787 RepID=A0A833WHT4_PHYIN|nr:hypothetical protein GN244_ATG05334 [Phytophthora infestans]